MKASITPDPWHQWTMNIVLENSDKLKMCKILENLKQVKGSFLPTAWWALCPIVLEILENFSYF